MDKKELLAELENLKKDLETNLTEKAKAEITLQVKALEEKLSGLDDLKKSVDENTATVKVIKDAADKNQEWINKEMANASRMNLMDKPEGFKEALEKGLTEKKEALKNWKSVGVSIDMKAVGDIGAGNFTTSGTTTFAGPTMIPGVASRSFATTHMRDILPTSQVNTDSVSVIRAVAGEGGPTSVAPGGLKPQSDLDYVKLIVPITKIAHHYRVPEEWLDDVSWLADDISQTGIAELMVLEDSKIVSNVAAGEFTGLIQNSTAYAAPSGLADGIATANNYDVLVAAQTQLRNAKRNPNFILTDNDSYARMILTKATTGEYVFGAPNMSIPNVFGVPIFPMTVAALANKFIVGDRNQAVIAIRKGITVRFYDQDRDNAITNMVTVVIEERLALVVKRTDAFVFGDFTDARARLDPAVTNPV